MLSRLISIALLSLPVLASPVPDPLADSQFYGPKYCTTLTSRTVESAEEVTGWTFPVAGSTCTAGSTQCSISGAKTYTVTYTITVGGSFDIGAELAGPLKAFSAGGSFSASYPWASSNAESVTLSSICHKCHTCQQQVTPQMLHVKGKTQKTNSCTSDQIGDEEDYQVFLPVTYANSAKGNEAVVNYSTCTVGDAHSKKYPRCPQHLHFFVKGI